jgi:hypothetical protein
MRSAMALLPRRLGKSDMRWDEKTIAAVCVCLHRMLDQRDSRSTESDLNELVCALGLAGAFGE